MFSVKNKSTGKIYKVYGVEFREGGLTDYALFLIFENSVWVWGHSYKFDLYEEELENNI